MSTENADKEVSPQTRAVRQGTGPRATVSVLIISILLAVILGAIVVGYFFLRSPAPVTG
jgi:hypothetical protein